MESTKKRSEYYTLNEQGTGYVKVLATDTESDTPAPAPAKPRRKRNRKKKVAEQPLAVASTSAEMEATGAVPKPRPRYFEIRRGEGIFEVSPTTSDLEDEPVAPPPRVKPNKRRAAKKKNYAESGAEEDFEGGSSDAWVPDEEEKSEVAEKAKPRRNKKLLKPPAALVQALNMGKPTDKASSNPPAGPRLKYCRAEGRPFRGTDNPPTHVFKQSNSKRNLSELVKTDINKLSREEIRQKLTLLRKDRKKRGKDSVLKNLLDLTELDDPSNAAAAPKAPQATKPKGYNAALKKLFNSVNPFVSAARPPDAKMVELAKLLAAQPVEEEEEEEGDLMRENMDEAIDQIITDLGLENVPLFSDMDSSLCDSDEEKAGGAPKRAMKPFDLLLDGIADQIVAGGCRNNLEAIVDGLDNLDLDDDDIQALPTRTSSSLRPARQSETIPHQSGSNVAGSNVPKANVACAVDGKPYGCAKCDKRFITDEQLTRHSTVHSEARRHVCEVCRYRFSKSSHLITHMRLHTGDKPHKCSLCDGKFAQLSDLTAHMNRHLGNKQYPCSTCKARFTTRGELTKHTRVHSGHKPYPCTLCEARFTTSGALTSHTLIHSGDKPFPCSICEYRSSHSSNLTKHMRVHSKTR